MWWRIGGAVGALGVGLGAFGAHGLKTIITDENLLKNWDTAAKYHLIHALALCLVAVHPRQPKAAGVLFSMGIAIFSGSLYLMTLTGARWLGAITPIGGVCLIAGWVVLAVAAPPDPRPIG